MQPTTPLTLALRAYVERCKTISTKRRSQPPTGRPLWPRDVLIFDTETTTDATQRLLFGWFRHAQWQDDGMLTCLQEGLIYADELPARDPAAYGTLMAYADRHHAEVVAGQPAVLSVLSRKAFVDGPLWDIAAGAQGLIVGFNLAFDLTRVATGYAPTRRRRGRTSDPFAGGLSLTLWDAGEGHGRPDSPYRPRVRWKHIDSKRSLLALGSRLLHPGHGQRRPVTTTTPGRFLDLKTLVFALTDQSHSLASACAAFRTPLRKTAVESHGQVTAPYIDYARQDVRATAALLEAVRQEFDRHPIALPPDRVRSPASMAKGYLRALGLRPPRQQFADVTSIYQGQAMTAYYGGRAEARIRNAMVPIVHCDFRSMYPTVNALLGLWDLLVADSLRIVDATAEVRSLLARVTLDGYFDPALWRELRGYALIQPQDDILPVRASYDAPSTLHGPATLGQGVTIGVNPLESLTPLWYALPDLVASTLLTGRAPHVLEAWRIEPEGRQASLQAVALRGDPASTIDPHRQDPFCRLVEARQRVKQRHDLSAQECHWLERALKVTANSGSYGVYAEMNPVELGTKKRETVRVHGGGQPFTVKTAKPEEPGEFCFPLFAALTTSGARLMLGLLERAVRDAGGHYAFCDTDSMAIVATEHGGLVPCGPRHTIEALSRADVEAVVRRFERLNPYDREAVPGSILKIESVNDYKHQWRQLYCVAISAKRYALFNLDAKGTIVLRKPSEHGLGHLLDPTRGPGDPIMEENPGGTSERWPQWIGDVWRWIIAQVRGQAVDRPVWFDRPAISRMTITSPRLLKTFAALNAEKPYSDQVKPMNFGLLAHLDRLRLPMETRPDRFQLIAPYEPDASQWETMKWLEKYSGTAYRISTDPEAPPPTVVVRSMGAEIERYRVHPEPKNADAQGKPCPEATVGLLQRRRICAGGILYIGKEANQIEEVNTGLITSLNDVLAIYSNVTETVWHRIMLPMLQHVPVARIAQAARVSKRQVKYYRAGVKQPTGRRRQAVLALILDETQYLMRSKRLTPNMRMLAERVLALHAKE